MQTTVSYVWTIMKVDLPEGVVTAVVSSIVDTISVVATTSVSHSVGSWLHGRLQKVVESHLGAAKPNSIMFEKEAQNTSRRFPL